MAPLARDPIIVALPTNEPRVDQFGNHILCLIELRFTDGTSIQLQRLYTPGSGAFTLDPTTPPDAAVAGPVNTFSNPAAQAAAEASDDYVQHPVYGWSHVAVDNLRQLPANAKAWLFPEQFGHLVPRNWARLPNTPEDPVNPPPSVPEPDLARSAASAAADPATRALVFGHLGAQDVAQMPPMAQPSQGAGFSTPRGHPTQQHATKAEQSTSSAKGADDQPATPGEDLVIATPINPNIMYSTMLNKPQLHMLHTVPNTSILFEVPNTSYVLPSGIDLTTAEILAFFPGLLHDPYFVYRAYSVGWDMHTMIHVSRMHRDVSWPLTFDVMRPLVTRGMAYVLGIGEDDWYEDEYKRCVPVVSRTKLQDYTSTGLSVTSSTQYPNKRDLKLSELSASVKVRPEGASAGQLTTLVTQFHNGQLTDDLTMSAVQGYITASGLPPKRHTAVEDEACFREWHIEATIIPEGVYE